MEFDLPPDYSEINKVVILGMGGSAIGGDLVSSLAVSEAKLPIIIHRDYNLPAFVDARTLVIASSYSGNTEETLSSFDQALRTDSKKLVVLSGNPAKQLANRFYGYLPVIYGAGIVAEAAHRWKTQLNENSKAWAFYEVFPELNHNAVVGYQFPQELASKIVVVLLRSAYLAERTQLRYQVTCQLLEQAKVSYQIVDGDGSSALSQLMSLVLFGDYVSYYLAILYRIDPTPVKAIDYLKEQLGRD